MSTEPPEKKYRPPGSELMPDDGIVDELAIELMLRGDRRVRLTREERIRAALILLEQGHDEKHVRYRLRLSPSVSKALMTEVYERLAPRELVAS